MSYEYPVSTDGSRPLTRPPAETRYHVDECLDSACLAIKASREREEFPALIALVLACKHAQEALER
jgi:hypothetical protein